MNDPVQAYTVHETVVNKKLQNCKKKERMYDQRNDDRDEVIEMIR